MKLNAERLAGKVARWVLFLAPYVFLIVGSVYGARVAMEGGGFNILYAFRSIMYLLIALFFLVAHRSRAIIEADECRKGAG